MIYVNDQKSGKNYRVTRPLKQDIELEEHQKIVKQAQRLLETGAIDTEGYTEIMEAVKENYALPKEAKMSSRELSASEIIEGAKRLKSDFEQREHT